MFRCEHWKEEAKTLSCEIGECPLMRGETHGKKVELETGRNKKVLITVKRKREGEVHPICQVSRTSGTSKGKSAKWIDNQWHRNGESINAISFILAKQVESLNALSRHSHASTLLKWREGGWEKQNDWLRQSWFKSINRMLMCCCVEVGRRATCVSG